MTRSTLYWWIRMIQFQCLAFVLAKSISHDNWTSATFAALLGVLMVWAEVITFGKERP